MIYDWKTFLTEWNNQLFEIAAKDPDYDEFFPPENFERKWLGFPGATEAQIVEVEKAFGRKLPPSYRQFLLFTNGWCSAWYDEDGELSEFSLVDFWSTEQLITRLTDYKERGWGWWKLPYSENEGITPLIPNNLERDYLNYADQDTRNVPAAFMLACLEIGGFDGNEYFLLNPLVIHKDGEWEAWTYSKESGFWRFPSFYDLVSYLKDSRSYMEHHYPWYKK